MSIDQLIIGKQHYKCANKPGAMLAGLENYECPLWKYETGIFDEAGYESYNQKFGSKLLCMCCHVYKFYSRKKNIEQKIVCNQHYKCANKPGTNFSVFSDYKCPRWKYSDGTFDGSGYDFDDITDNNTKETSKKALCISCFSYKASYDLYKIEYDKYINKNNITT